MPTKTSAIIQGPILTGSSRLPRKVLEDVGGRPMLAHTVARLGRCRRLDCIAIATTDQAGDDAVEALARDCGVPCYRGSENDVLSRFVVAARGEACDVVVRINGDCPLIDPGVVDQVVEVLAHSPGANYASNSLKRTYPRGLDAEAITTQALLRLDKLASSAPDREHVTLGAYTTFADQFRQAYVLETETVDNSDLRWTVDEPSDLALIRAIYGHFGESILQTDYRAIVAFLRAHPEIVALNAQVKTWSPKIDLAKLQ